MYLIEHESDVDSLDFAPDTKLVLLSQTTLSVDETADTIAALKAKFPWIQEPPSSDICYATSNRQAAVKLVPAVRLRGDCRIGQLLEFRATDGGGAGGLGERGKAYRVDDASELDPAWFEGLESVGISSGASVPDELVSGVIDALQNLGFTGMKSVETIKENMHFVLPAECAGKVVILGSLREGSQERSPRADWCGNGVQDLEQVLWIHAHRQASLAAGDQNLVELQGAFIQHSLMTCLLA